MLDALKVYFKSKFIKIGSDIIDHHEFNFNNTSHIYIYIYIHKRAGGR